MCYALAAELRVVLEKHQPAPIPGPPDFVRCQSVLGLGFWMNFRISICMLYVQTPYACSSIDCIKIPPTLAKFS